MANVNDERRAAPRPPIRLVRGGRDPRSPEERERRLRKIARWVLGIGLLAAAVVYLVAGPEPENPLGYDPMQTKSYLHDLELYGGKANILAVEFRDWFIGLWFGRNLAYTIAVLSVVTALALRWLSSRAPYDVEDDDVEG